MTDSILVFTSERRKRRWGERNEVTSSVIGTRYIDIQTSISLPKLLMMVFTPTIVKTKEKHVRQNYKVTDTQIARQTICERGIQGRKQIP